jgi:hypothetical protein
LLGFDRGEKVGRLEGVKMGRLKIGKLKVEDGRESTVDGESDGGRTWPIFSFSIFSSLFS